MSQPASNSTGSSASAQEPASSRTRYCSTKGCKSRLARATIDPHVLCVICRGSECDLQNRCKVCEGWSESTMLDYLNHLAKLEKRRVPKQQASQGAAASMSDSAAPERESSIDRDSLKEDIKNDLKAYLDRKMDESSAHVVKEIKFLFKGMKSGKFPIPDDDDEVPPETAAQELSYLSDHRYVQAKSLYDCGALDQRAYNNIVLMCKADASRNVNVDVDPLFGPHDDVPDNVARDPDPSQVPGPSGVNKRKRIPSGFDPNEEPDWEPETDFGDLVNCIVCCFPDAKEAELREKAHEFLIGVGAVSNKREFIKLKLFAEMREQKKELDEKVSKVQYGPNKPFNVWPRKRSYYKVHDLPDTVKINPRIAEVSHMKNLSSFSFSSSEALALDRALAELVQAQSFSFWLLSALFSFLDHEDFSPTNSSLFIQYKSVLSSTVAAQSNWTLSLQAFLNLIKRKAVLNKLFPSVLHHHREELFRSPVFAEFMFDEGVLDRVIAAHSKNQLDKSQFQLAKFFSSASLSKTPSSFTVTPRGARRPFFRPFGASRGRGGRGGKGRGKSGGGNKKNANKQPGQNQSKNA